MPSPRSVRLLSAEGNYPDSPDWLIPYAGLDQRTGIQRVGGAVRVPEDWRGVGATEVRAVWVSNAIVGQAQLRFVYRIVSGSAAIDGPSTEEVTVTPVPAGSVESRIETTFGLTTGNLNPGDLLLWRFERVNDDPPTADTLAAPVYLMGLDLVYEAN